MTKTRVAAIPAPTDANLREVARAVKNVLDVREGVLGDPLDANVTFRDLVDGGVVSVTTVRRGSGSASVVVAPPTGSSSDYDPTTDFTPPPAPQGFTATSMFAGITLSWLQPQGVYNFAYTEIWRADTDSIGAAVRIATTPTASYVDFVGNSETRYYWIRFVTQADIAGPYNATAGTVASTSQDPAFLLEVLSGSISESELAQELSARIDLIDGTVSLQGSVDARIAEAVAADLTAPPTPPGFTATAGIMSVLVTVSGLNYTQGHGHRGTAVYGYTGATPSFELATLIGEFQGSQYSFPSEPSTTWHLWAKFVTNDGVYSEQPVGGATGIEVTTGQDVSLLLDSLQGQISSSELAQSLSTRIDLIDADAIVPGSVNSRVAAEASARTQAIGAEQQARADAIAVETSQRISQVQSAANTALQALLAVDNEQQLRLADVALARQELTEDLQTSVSAEAAARTTLATQLRGGYEGADLSLLTSGLLYQERLARSTQDNALAQQITLLSAGAGEQFDWQTIWYFDTGVESWTGNGTPTVSQGWLRPANQASGAYVESPTGVGADGNKYGQVRLRIRKTGNPTFAGYLWWRTASDSTWDTSRRIALTAPTFDANGIGLITTNIGWSVTIDRIRVDLSSAQTASDCFEIDWVAIGRPSPGASSAQLLEEQEARALADSAEAGARETLSAKLTGVNDPSSLTLSTLTSGLLYDERVARVTADTSISSSLTTLTTTVGQMTSTVSTLSESVTDLGESSAQTQTELVSTNRRTRQDIDQGAEAALQDMVTLSKERAERLSSMAVAREGLYTNITEGLAAEASARLTLAATVGANTAAITAEQSARASADSAISASVTALTATVGTNSASISNIETSKIGYCTIGGLASDQTTRSACEAAGGVWNVGIPVSTAVKQVSVSDGSSSATLEQRFAAQKTTNTGLLAQYTVKVDVNGFVSGFGLASTLSGATPTSDFIVNASKFSVASPAGSSVPLVSPFTVVTQTIPATSTTPQINPGVYIDGAYIKGGSIQGSQILGGTIENSKLINVSADKITGAALTATSYIESDGYVAGTSGWKIHGNGAAEFSGVTVRGTVEASSGNIGGVLIDSTRVRSSGMTSFSAGSGFWLGNDGKAQIGSASGSKLVYDGTNVGVYLGSGGRFELTGSGGTGITFDGSTLDIVLAEGGNTFSVGSRVDALGSLYSVKMDSSGVISGFGLSSSIAEGGAVTSKFIVNTDQFAVIAPNRTAGQLNSVPFAVLTTQQTINGVTFQPGVYIDGASINNGTVSKEKIGSVDADTIQAGFAQTVDFSGSTIYGSELFIGGTPTYEYNYPGQEDRITGIASVASPNIALKSTGAEFNVGYFKIKNGNTLTTPFEVVNNVVRITQAAIGTITAGQIDSRGLSIKDADGNIILSAGSSLNNSVLNIPGINVFNQETAPTTYKRGDTWIKPSTGAQYKASYQQYTAQDCSNEVLREIVGLDPIYPELETVLKTVVDGFALWDIDNSGTVALADGITFSSIHSGTVTSGSTYDKWINVVKPAIEAALPPWVLASNNTYIDASGNIQGVSGNAGTAVSNAILPSSTNLQYNADFSSGTGGSDGWVGYDLYGITSFNSGVNLSTDWYIAPYNGSGTSVYWASQTGRTALDGHYLDIAGKAIPVAGGKRYVVSAYTGAHRCKVAVFAYVYDSNNTLLETFSGSAATVENNAESAGGKSITGYKRNYCVKTVHANASYLRVILRKYNTFSGQPDSYMFVGRVQVEEVGANATTPGPWVPNGHIDASAVRALNPITSSNVSTYIASAAIGDAQIANTLQSTNWSVANGTGWQINKAGSATFNDVALRGAINGGQFTGYAWPTTAGGGFHVGPSGALFGNNNADVGSTGFLQISNSGDIWAGSPGNTKFSVVSGQVSAIGINITRDTRIAYGIATFPDNGSIDDPAAYQFLRGANFVWSPAYLVLYIDTGYNDYLAISNISRPALAAKAVVTGTHFWRNSGNPGSSLVYSIGAAAEVVSVVDHYVSGASGTIPGGTVKIRVVVPLPTNIYSSIYAIRITQIEWSLMKVT